MKVAKERLNSCAGSYKAPCNNFSRHKVQNTLKITTIQMTRSRIYRPKFKDSTRKLEKLVMKRKTLENKITNFNLRCKDLNCKMSKCNLKNLTFQMSSNKKFSSSRISYARRAIASAKLSHVPKCTKKSSLNYVNNAWIKTRELAS